MAEPLLVDEFMPQYDLAIVYSRVYRASPSHCFETVVGADLLQTPLIRLLIGARAVPVTIAERLRGQHRPSERPTFRLRDMPSIGWVVLGERLAASCCRATSASRGRVSRRALRPR